LGKTVPSEQFWKHKTLSEMTSDEWESLCDGCGKCCVLKLEDADTGHIYYTDVGCKLLDCDNSRCMDYAGRKAIVPDCVVLSPENLDTLSWMPMTCAYRLLNEGEDLPHWHPLITGDPDSPRKAGHSVAGQIVPEAEVKERDMIDHIREW